jgi:hypothetical protein
VSSSVHTCIDCIDCVACIHGAVSCIDRTMCHTCIDCVACINGAVSCIDRTMCHTCIDCVACIHGAVSCIDRTMCHTCIASYMHRLCSMYTWGRAAGIHTVVSTIMQVYILWHPLSCNPIDSTTGPYRIYLNPKPKP